MARIKRGIENKAEMSSVLVNVINTILSLIVSLSHNGDSRLQLLKIEIIKLYNLLR